jgi:protein involved in polysaccharide export with SLBB domain
MEKQTKKSKSTSCSSGSEKTLSAGFLLRYCKTLSFVLPLALSLIIGNVAVADEFMITPGDELRIFIPGLRPPEQLYTVDPDGHIDLGLQGKVKVSGYPTKKAESLVKAHLGKYLRSTTGIALFLKRSRRTILITGCVAQPGLITIEANVDLWQAIHQAGGVTECADLSRVFFLRNGLTLPVNVRAFLARDTDEPLPRLKAGDTVFVSAAPGIPLSSTAVAAPFLDNEALNRKVFVIGAVNAPGMYDRSEALDVLTAVALAGGPLELADLSNTTLLTKDKSIKIDLQKALQRKVRLKKLIPGKGGAIVYVPYLHENVDTRMGDYINLIGPFERSGRIPISGPMKLIDIIGIVGGPGEAGKIHKVTVIEEGRGYSLANKYDVEDYLEEGGWVGRILVMPGSTVAIDRRDLVAYQTTLQTIGTLAMISSSMAFWLSATNNLSN